jgi:Xaa-Pro aminopeptidase
VIEQRVLMGGHYAAEVELPQIYRRRRELVRAELGAGGVAVLLGAGDARGYGDVGSFRQDPTFFYLTGIELPNAVLVLRPERETLLLPGRRPNLEAWTGPKFGRARDCGDARLDEVLDRDATEIVVDARRRPQRRGSSGLPSGSARAARCGWRCRASRRSDRSTSRSGWRRRCASGCPASCCAT